MPECVNGNKKAKLNPGDLCKSCYATENGSSKRENYNKKLGEDELIAGISIQKSLNELNVVDLVKIIQFLIKPISDEIDKIKSKFKKI